MLNHQIFNHRNIYYFGLILLAVSLPVSVFMMSVAQFILVINWILEGNFNHKLQVLANRKSILLFISIYFVHIICLIYTSYPEGFTGNCYNALKDLRIKFPVLILPIIIGTSAGLDLRKLKLLLLLFIASVTASTLLSMSVLFGLIHRNINDIRDISLYISHIRFALLINMAIFSLGYFLFSKKYALYPFEKALFPVIIIWLTIFLFILQSLTGISVLIISILIVIGYWASRLKKPAVRSALIVMMVAIILMLSFYIKTSVSKYYNIEQVNREVIETRTKSGNPYYHNFDSKSVENGHYVDLYICEKELRDEWNRISSFGYDAHDMKGQDLKYTLIRYLTSKGLRKDAEGIHQLTKDDIRLIEKGFANNIYINRFSLYPRIYEIIWELDLYFKGGDPSGHSLAQRIEYIKTGIRILKENFWFGVGTGDVQNSFDKQYEIMKTPLEKEYQRRAHNQFLTFFISFGFTGFLWIMFAMLYPVCIERRTKDYLFVIFLIIAFISMLSEDTWETQPGVTFFVFFYVLFLMGREKDIHIVSAKKT